MDGGAGADDCDKGMGGAGAVTRLGLRETVPRASMTVTGSEGRIETGGNGMKISRSAGT